MEHEFYEGDIVQIKTPAEMLEQYNVVIEEMTGLHVFQGVVCRIEKTHKPGTKVLYTLHALNNKENYSNGMNIRSFYWQAKHIKPYFIGTINMVDFMSLIGEYVQK